jgi:hypothetical protein
MFAFGIFVLPLARSLMLGCAQLHAAAICFCVTPASDSSEMINLKSMDEIYRKTYMLVNRQTNVLVV